MSLSALAADEASGRTRAGTNASVEGGVGLGGTGVSSAGPATGAAPLTRGTSETQPRSGDTPARRDKVDDKEKAEAAVRIEPHKREGDAASGVSGSKY